MRITVEVLNRKVIDRDFNRLKEVPADISGILKDAEKEFHAIQAENFQSENVKGASGRYAPLKARTLEIKRRKHGSFADIAGILIDSGDLYKSLTRHTQHTVSIINKQDAAFGTSLKRARLHQTGTKHMPARPPIDFSDLQKRRMQKVIQKGLIKEVRKQTTFVMREIGEI